MGKMSKRERMKLRRRKKMMRQAGMAALSLVFICALAFIGYAVFKPAPETQTAYYIEEEDTEVLAPPIVVENEDKYADMTDEEIAALFAPEAQPTLPPVDAATFTVTCVGDCTLGGSVNSSSYRRFQSYVSEKGVDYFFENFRELFEADDLTLVNFEGTLTTATSKRRGRTFNFKGDPENLGIVSGSSVEVATLANNHAFDFKQQGFDDTVAALEGAGIATCGFGQSSVVNANGVDVGFLGFTEWDYTEKEIAAEIRAMDEKCDVLIVSMHWGEEKKYSATDTQQELAHLAVDSGADLVIGHHPHVVGGIENYNGVQIVYSLGNFCFGGNDSPYDTDAFVYQQTFTMGADGVAGVSAKLYPISVSSSTTTNNYQPVMLHGEDANRVLKKIAKNSEAEALALIEVVE